METEQISPETIENLMSREGTRAKSDRSLGTNGLAVGSPQAYLIWSPQACLSGDEPYGLCPAKQGCPLPDLAEC